MDFLIFSPTKGFFKTPDQWVDEPDDASLFDFVSAADLDCDANDARIANPELYTNEGFDEVLDRLLETLEQEPYGSAVAFFAHGVMDAPVTYENDSEWLFNGQAKEWDEFSVMLRAALSEMSREDLQRHYNDFCSNQIHLDHDEGFIHQQVL